jgi:hypothetical protein
LLDFEFSDFVDGFCGGFPGGVEFDGLFEGEDGVVVVTGFGVCEALEKVGL